MSIIFVLFLMIFFHIVDDFHLQGILAHMKQKSWWEKNYPEEMYKNDYLVALNIHGFSWSFMIMLPICIYFKFELTPIMIYCFIMNWLIHSFIDDLKANKRVINLKIDQFLHFIQIVFTFVGIFFFWR